MKVNYHTLIGFSYIAFCVGLACASVGDMPTVSTEPHDFWLPVTMFSLIVTPFYIGYLAGSSEE